MMHQVNGSLHSRNATSGVFNEAWLANARLDGTQIILIALNTVRECQESMSTRLEQLRKLARNGHVQALFQYMRGLFLHDEWILNEYSGGFNTHSLADLDDVNDIIAMSETSLQVSA